MPPLEEVLAGLGVLSIIAYALLAGADFGAGAWDLLARGPRKEEQREAIAHEIGPIWEANHVWMIFLVVIMFSCYPAAWAALSIALFIPLHFVLVGILLRGASFVFRAHGAQAAGFRSAWGPVFGAASVFTPFLLGMCIGAVSEGTIRVSDGVVRSGYWDSWTGPVAWIVGVLALLQTTYLAAVYLCVATEGELREDFRKRALLFSFVVPIAATIAFPVVITQAPHLWAGLTRPTTLPVVLGGMALGLASWWLLLHRRYELARIAVVGEVIAIILGWALAQRPYIIYPDVTVEAAATSPAMLRFMLATVPIGFALLLPSLWLLFHVFAGKNPAAKQQPAVGFTGTGSGSGFIVARRRDEGQGGGG